MKRIVVLFLALSLVVSLFGCKQSDTNQNAVTDTLSTGIEKPTEEPVVLKSYTVSDEEAAAARMEIVATVGDEPLTNGVLQLCYWMGIYTFMNSSYGQYPSLFGLDYALPLDKQESPEKGVSWQEIFLEDALSTWHLYQAVALEFKRQGMDLPKDLQTELDETSKLLEETAKKNGFATPDDMIRSEAGAGCTAEDYLTYNETYYYYWAFATHISENTKVTQEDIEAYFLKNEESLAESKITKDSGNVFGVRHILISPEGGTKEGDKTIYSEAEWEACRVKAQSLLDQWAAGEATEASFAKLAGEHSTDPGSKDAGGLYEDLDKNTNFVEPFKNWYLAEGRQVGDYGLVKTDYGYHIMYLSSIEAKWIAHCRDSIISEAIDEAMKAAQEAYPMDTDFDKIVLGEVKLIKKS
jgi:hypothetical protein